MMVLWVRLRSELRYRWRSWLALALLSGVAGGMVIAAAAAARRTESAYPRFLRAQRAVDLAVIDRNPLAATATKLADVERLPGIADYERFDLFLGGIRTDEDLAVSLLDSPPASTASGRLGWEIHRPKLLKGRRPSPNRPDEVSIGFLTAERYRLEVGSKLYFKLAGNDPLQLLQFQQVVEGSRDAWDFASGPTVTLHVVGIEATPGGFPPLAPGQGPPLFLTPAFHKAYAAASLKALGTAIILKNESALAEFRDAAERTMGQGAATFLTKPEHASKIERSTRLQVTALWLVAALTGFAAVVIVAQAFAREVFADSGEYPTLAAIGMTRRQLWALGIARAGLICGPATISAAAVALLLSPAAPIGLARIAEPDPGFRLDRPAVVLGIGILIATVLLTTAVPAWWAARASQSRPPRTFRQPVRVFGALSSALALLRPPAVVLAGVRMALHPRSRGRSAVPVRSTIACASASVAALVAAVCFGSSLQHLVRTPALYGQRWDARIGSRAIRDISDDVVPRLKRERSISDISEGTLTEGTVARQVVGVLAVDSLQGEDFPVAVQGRPPRSPDEVLLGTRTFRATKARIGGVIEVRMGNSSRNMRVVGRGIHPDVSDSGRFGEGLAMTYQAVKALNPEASRNVFLVRFSPDADPDAAYRQLQRMFSRVGLARGGPPTDLVGFGRIENVPLLLSALVALVGVGTVVHTLVMAVHRRRRDLAVLKTIGFIRRQVALAVVWQATTLGAMVALVGLPLGLLAGSRAWRLFAGELGVRPEMVVPVSSVLLMVPATLLLANAVSAVPARIAANTHPGVELRAE